VAIVAIQFTWFTSGSITRLTCAILSFIITLELFGLICIILFDLCSRRHQGYTHTHLASLTLIVLLLMGLVALGVALVVEMMVETINRKKRQMRE